MENHYDKMRSVCWVKAMEAFGTHYIYKRRMNRLNAYTSWAKITGFVLPVLLGGLVGSYYQDKKIMEVALAITTPIAIAQLVLSAILTANNVEVNQLKYTALSTKNLLLSADFKELGEFPPVEFPPLKARFDVLAERERALIEEDVSLSDKENRMGMRYGLRQFQRRCVGCDVIPLSMKATDCEVCGNF